MTKQNYCRKVWGFAKYGFQSISCGPPKQFVCKSGFCTNVCKRNLYIRHHYMYQFLYGILAYRVLNCPCHPYFAQCQKSPFWRWRVDMDSFLLFPFCYHALLSAENIPFIRSRNAEQEQIKLLYSKTDYSQIDGKVILMNVVDHCKDICMTFWNIWQ